MKERPILMNTSMVRATLEGRKTQTRRLVKNCENIDLLELWNHNKDYVLSQSPYGKVGDVLWVREAYCHHYFEHDSHAYMADWGSVAAEYCTKPKWKPSIHMPKEAARIFLRITDVRVEKLQAISASDAIAEGISCTNETPFDDEPNVFFNYINPLSPYPDPIDSFRSLWISICGQSSWDEDPLVWVCEFERIIGYT